MKKFLGYTVMFFPFIVVLVGFFAWNWEMFLFVVCAVVLCVDVFFWFAWFIVAGKTILGDDS